MLGQLAFQPWSAYELIKEMSRNFHYFYPKAESGLYEELKKLEKLGLAASSVETKGKKDRTVYTITAAGREALARWLDTEPDHFWLEFDGLLRVFMARFGRPEALQLALQKVEADAGRLVGLAEKIGQEYLSDTAPGQAEIVQRACVFDFLLHYGMMYKDWLARTQQYLTAVENLSEADARARAKAVFEDQLRHFGLNAGAEK